MIGSAIVSLISCPKRIFFFAGLRTATISNDFVRFSCAFAIVPDFSQGMLIIRISFGTH